MNQMMVVMKAFIFIVLVCSGLLQIKLGRERIMNTVTGTSHNLNRNSKNNSLFIPVNQSKYGKPLPLEDKDTSESNMKWAIEFLKLPVWSAGYNNCAKDDHGNSERYREVSCYELYRAATVIETWENSLKQKETKGLVFVNTTNQKFPQKLSMLYHGIQLAISLNKMLVTFHNDFEPLKLPSSIFDAIDNVDVKNRFDVKNNLNFNLENLTIVPTNHLFNCVDFRSIDNIEIKSSSWAQSLYTSNIIAPIIKQNFGYHAAYILGNYLFGSSEKPKSECFIDNTEIVVEGWVPENKGLDSPTRYHEFYNRCGFNDNETTMLFSSSLITTNSSIIHDLNMNVDFSQSNYDKILHFDSNDQHSLVCELHALISARKIVRTFGSMLGFWANALQGSKGYYINGIDHICVNLTNSQQGSLFHTFVPRDYHWLYYANDWFYLCGTNVDEAHLYLDYLLW
ncbi:hypothetical protein TRFO_01180 [Tritrichomonas foetus]|uniref:Uncharacterized protein n=1 Tax=Tritrichomonas foetus TaxID=1144522 RepID=A0A1J4KJF5_9EUKA|nr:hypothetical protein TRFO_01180 [Tritrichomonas foetus]|eukprot:OHT11226.1 hypothetical protein TRFO_01180 [Tritrichomonas foetus]